MAEQQPDSLEEQDDRPEVECMDLESSMNVDLPFLDDEVVSEDDEANLTEETTAQQPANTAKKCECFVQYVGESSFL